MEPPIAISGHSDEAVPEVWRDEIARVLIPAPAIAERVARIAAVIEADYARKDLVVVALLNGTVMFLADLIRHISLPLHLDFMGVSSYRSGTTAGQLVYTRDLALDVTGRDVLVVDDILDSGQTLSSVSGRLKSLAPASLRICVLLEKRVPRSLAVTADYTAFSIPDEFVVGYGLDYAERYRNLPFLGVVHPDQIQKS